MCISSNLCKDRYIYLSFKIFVKQAEEVIVLLPASPKKLGKVFSQIVYVQNNRSNNETGERHPSSPRSSTFYFCFQNHTTSQKTRASNLGTLSNRINFPHPFFPQTLIDTLKKKKLGKNGEKMFEQKLSFIACITIWESFLKRETSLINISTIFVRGQNIAIAIIFTLWHSLG